MQRIETTVGVAAGVHAVAAAGGRTGPWTARRGGVAPARDRLRTLTAGLRAAIVGWSPAAFAAYPPGADGLDPEPAASWPAGRWSPLIFRGGRLLSVGQDRAWWQDEYSSTWTLGGPREAAPAIALPTEIWVSVNDADPVQLEGGE